MAEKICPLLLLSKTMVYPWDVLPEYDPYVPTTSIASFVSTGWWTMTYLSISQPSKHTLVQQGVLCTISLVYRSLEQRCANQFLNSLCTQYIREQTLPILSEIQPERSPHAHLMRLRIRIVRHHRKHIIVLKPPTPPEQLRTLEPRHVEKIRPRDNIIRLSECNISRPGPKLNNLYPWVGRGGKGVDVTEFSGVGSPG